MSNEDENISETSEYDFESDYSDSSVNSTDNVLSSEVVQSVLDNQTVIIQHLELLSFLFSFTLGLLVFLIFSRGLKR